MFTQLADNLWLIRYPLPKLGADLRRNVSVIRLSSGELVIHSTGPFTSADVEEIRSLGKPAWIVEAMLHHDTFAKEGRDAFPGIPYLAPPGFSKLVDFPVDVLTPQAAWGEELRMIHIEGMPGYEEYVFLHVPSRTLIVADLVFNFGDDEPLWTEMLLKVAVGGKHHPGVARPFKAGVKDEGSFMRSIKAMLAWDFDRVIVGHGDVIESGGKEKVTAALAAAGFEVSS